MRLEVLLPFAVFADVADVAAIVAPTSAGSFGLLPNRLDCVAALVPGILAYRTASGEAFLAVDEGVMVKTGAEVRVSVRRALRSANLGELQAAVKQQFLREDAEALGMKSAMRRIEGSLMHGFATMSRDESP